MLSCFFQISHSVDGGNPAPLAAKRKPIFINIDFNSLVSDPLAPPLFNVALRQVVQDWRHWAAAPKKESVNIKSGGARGGVI